MNSARATQLKRLHQPPRIDKRPPKSLFQPNRVFGTHTLRAPSVDADIIALHGASRKRMLSERM
jgi:hypothetical protein